MAAPTSNKSAADQQTIRTWTDFQAFVDRRFEVRSDTYHVFAFRGHANTNWLLQPTILREGLARKVTMPHKVMVDLEARLDEEANQYRHLYGNTPSSLPKLIHPNLYNWALLRHYGGPSRVLDWTTSPYVALYFAVRDDFKSDGHLWWVSHTEAARLRPMACPGVSDDRPFDLKEERNRLWFVPIPLPTNRAAAQQGMLSVCEDVRSDHGEVLGRYWEKATDKSTFGKVTIAGENKREFLRRLRSMNINGRTLFPDMVGLGMSGQDIMRGNPISREDPYQFKDHF